MLSRKSRFFIRQALKEDIGTGDITTDLLIGPRLFSEARIVAKQGGVLAGSLVVREVFHSMDRRLKVVAHAWDGARVRKGQMVFSIRGLVRSILKAERVALNFLSHLSGVATLTRQFVDQVRGTRAQIFDTRKTTPLWRELERQAVRAGGGSNHRFGLWDQVLVKDNHRAVMRMTTSTDSLVRSKRLSVWLGRGRKRPFTEVEVANLREFAQALAFAPEAVLLDHFSIRDLNRAVRMTRVFRQRPILEASGDIRLANVRAIAKTGVDRISVGALTHSAGALDFSLEVKSVTHP